MPDIEEGEVIRIKKEHLNREINGTRIHPLRSALYDATGGDIEMKENPDGSVIDFRINGMLYILCDRIQLWLRACKALDGRVSPIKMELIVSEDGEFMFSMNYN